MGRFDTTKATINANIKKNGNQEITGSILNSVMTEMVDATDAELTELSERIDNLPQGGGDFDAEGNYLFNEDGTPTARSAKILNGTPMGRFVDSEELLGGLFFLTDDKAASAITGVVLPIDCGFAAYSGV